MADSQYIFDYLNDIWDLLPDEDRIRFGETWKAYEQTYGYVWMQQFESDMANTIQYLPLYNIKRWLQHTFDDATELDLSATFTSNQGFTQPINLADRYLIKLDVDGGAPVQVDLRGATPSRTTLVEIVNNINNALSTRVASAISNGSLLQLVSPTSGPASSFTFYPATQAIHDASAIILGLDPNSLPRTVPEFPFAFQLGEGDIIGIPVLQDKIHDELIEIRLVEGTDYAVEFGTGIISFAEMPPATLWAKDTLCNFETPYNNFGYLMDFYDRNTAGYLKAVQGLWFAFWNGPSPENIKRSLYLLFGLPTASKPGTVVSVNSGVILVKYVDGSTESFAVPSGLSPIVGPGDTITQFQPLVSGINIFDKINYPGFLAKEGGRAAVQPFLTQFASRGEAPDTDETKALTILENTTYLPQISVYAFTNPTINLSNVQTFLRNIQPRSRTFLFQILVGRFFDQLALSDEGLTGNPTDQWPNGQPALGLALDFDATSNLDWNNNTLGRQDQWDDAENNLYTYMVLDDSVIGFGEHGVVEVYNASDDLIDSFNIEG